MKKRFSIQPLYQSYLPLIESIEQISHITPWSGKIILDSFNKRSHNFGLFFHDELVGYYFSEFVAGEMTLHNICISPDFQGKGGASKLMSHLLELATKLKAEEVWLEVRESNDPAKHLYEKYGFTHEGLRKNYYSLPNSDMKENAIAMKKCLLEAN